MMKLSVAALVASTALIPAAFAQNNTVDITSIDDGKICQELVTFVDRNDTDATGVTADRAGTIAAGNDPRICREAYRLAAGEEISADAAAATDGAEIEAEATAGIKVAVPEPQVDVQQRAPQVAVEQPRPDVNVTPGRPIVTVNQAEPVVRVETTPPTVTIDMPKPQILVEIPDPTVDVAMAQPRVTVEQPQPVVNVTQGEVKLDIGNEQVAQDQGEARVNIEQENATVRVDAAEGSNIDVAEVQPEVRYNAAQPRVEMSEQGEPKIQFNQSGDADVRFRQMSADETRAAASERQTAEAGNEEMRAAAASQDDAAEGETRMNVSAAANNAPADQVRNGQTFLVEDLMDLPLIGADGETIGDVENFVNRGGETYVVVGSGGLLGLGEKQVALPMSEVYFRDDRLYTNATSEAAVEEMDEIDPESYAPLGTDQDVEVVIQ